MVRSYWASTSTRGVGGASVANGVFFGAYGTRSAATVIGADGGFTGTSARGVGTFEDGSRSADGGGCATCGVSMADGWPPDTGAGVGGVPPESGLSRATASGGRGDGAGRAGATATGAGVASGSSGGGTSDGIAGPSGDAASEASTESTCRVSIRQ